MSVQLLRRRFTVDEYHGMTEAGILGEDDRVELIEGQIVEMAPIGSKHAAALYASAGISEIWVADLGAETLEVFRAPSAGGYQSHERLRRGNYLSPPPPLRLFVITSLPEVDVNLDGLLVC